MSLHLLNTCIVPWFAGCANVRIQEVNLETARQLAAEMEIVSHVGHAATALVLTGLLGREIVMDRKPWDGRGKALTGSRPTFPPCRFPWAGQRGGRCNAHRPSTRRACR